MKNVEAYSSFSSVGSDHRIVSDKIKLNLRSEKATIKEKQYDWKFLRCDEDLQQQDSVAIRNRYEALRQNNEPATEKYQHLIEANKATADELIPTEKKNPRKSCSLDKRIAEKKTQRKSSFFFIQNGAIA